MLKQEKVVILGAGHVGSHCALALLQQQLNIEIVLVDIDEEKARAQALDLADAADAACLVRAGTLADCSGAAVILLCIGMPRQSGQTRLDLLEDSVRRLKTLLPAIKPYVQESLVITITNPADIVAGYVRQGLGLPRTQVFGTGTLLDSVRLVRILSSQSGISQAAIEALVLGEHGASSMIPFSQIRLASLPLTAFPALNPEDILAQTCGRGMDIIEGKGSTEFGIGQAVACLVRAILADAQAVFPLSMQLQGEYGQQDVQCGVPCLVGRSGIQRVIELPLTEAEQAQLAASCQVIRAHTDIAWRL